MEAPAAFETENPVGGGAPAASKESYPNIPVDPNTVSGSGIYGNLSDWDAATPTGAVIKFSGKEVRAAYLSPRRPRRSFGPTRISPRPSLLVPPSRAPVSPKDG